MTEPLPDSRDSIRKFLVKAIKKKENYQKIRCNDDEDARNPMLDGYSMKKNGLGELEESEEEKETEEQDKEKRRRREGVR